MNKEDLVQLWLDAEEENRKHTVEGDTLCLELKDSFPTYYGNLSDEDKVWVNIELINLAGL